MTDSLFRIRLQGPILTNKGTVLMNKLCISTRSKIIVCRVWLTLHGAFQMTL